MYSFTGKFVFIAGPCVIEGRDETLFIAEELKKVFESIDADFIFKASFDKANRTSVGSYRGPGMDEGLKILAEVKEKFNMPVLTDVHEVSQINGIKEIVDIIQIPAFLCRQTDLVVAAAKTGKCVNLKKAQFMAPEDMVYVVEKVKAQGNDNIFLTERGTSFGYGNLVVDFRAFPIMKKTGLPVIYDVTHSLQRPSAANGVSGGDREFVETMACAAVAAGIDGLFMEVHPNPNKAMSDKHTSYSLNKVALLVERIMKIRSVL